MTRPVYRKEDAMSVGKAYRMKILKSTKVLKPEPRPPRVPKVRVKPSTREILEAFRRARGYDEIVARIPKAATLAGWEKGTQIAYFSVCGKSGSATWLDLWDCDHFDGITDMQRSIND